MSGLSGPHKSRACRFRGDARFIFPPRQSDTAAVYCRLCLASHSVSHTGLILLRQNQGLIFFFSFIFLRTFPSLRLFESPLGPFCFSMTEFLFTQYILSSLLLSVFLAPCLALHLTHADCEGARNPSVSDALPTSMLCINVSRTLALRQGCSERSLPMHQLSKHETFQFCVYVVMFIGTNAFGSGTWYFHGNSHL